MSKKWYVVHTYSGYENKVSNNLRHIIESSGLEDRIFDIQIPTEEVTEIKDGGKRVTSEKKIFPGYVLVRTVDLEQDKDLWSIIRNTAGVTGFVGTQGKPVPLTRSEYEKITKRRQQDAAKPGIKVSSNLNVGMSIKVVSGPLAEFDGTITEVHPEAGKIKVTVSIFGRETPVELSYDQVARI